MPRKKKDNDQGNDLQEIIINKISETVSLAVRHLPNSSGDLLNFLADLIAALTLIYLWKAGKLPASQVLLSFIIMLAFLIICFTGTLLMRNLDRRERPS